MIENKIHFLGEKDYIPVMETQNRLWREQHVKNGKITTRDGIRLNYYHAEHPHPKAVVVILHGYCGFWGKYHEFAWYLWQAGYTIFFLEQRCHGYSGGKLPEYDVVHIDTFDTYVKDLREFMDRVVAPASGDLPRLMLAHSMGGAVGALFLGTYPKTFSGAVLTSPMLKLHTGKMTPRRIEALRTYMKMTRSQKKLCFGQHHFDPEPEFPNSSTLSKARYMYFFRQRIFDSHYRTSAPSFGWVMAAVDVTGLIMKRAHRIKIPVTLMQSGIDTLVDAAGFSEFMKRVPQARLIRYENAKHELFNAASKERKQYFADVIAEFDRMSGQ